MRQLADVGVQHLRVITGLDRQHLQPGEQFAGRRRFLACAAADRDETKDSKVDKLRPKLRESTRVGLDRVAQQGFGQFDMVADTAAEKGIGQASFVVRGDEQDRA